MIRRVSFIRRKDGLRLRTAHPLKEVVLDDVLDPLLLKPLRQAASSTSKRNVFGTVAVSRRIPGGCGRQGRFLGGLQLGDDPRC